MSKQELHVIFGTGPLGQSVATALLEHGRPVAMVNRSGNRPAAIPPGVDMRKADAMSLDAARMAAQQATHVYNCTNAPYHRWEQEMRPLFGNILQAAIDQHACYVMGDNVYAYGDTDGQPISEATPEKPTSRKGIIRRDLAGHVRAAHADGRVRAAIVRGSDFIGPGVLEAQMGERVFGPAILGKTAQVVGNVDVPHTVTFITDMGRAMALVGQHDRAFGETWHAPNSRPYTAREILGMIYQEAGHPLGFRSAGRALLNTLGLFRPVIREVVEMMYQFEQPFIVDGSRFSKEFGLDPTPMPEVVRQTVAWYRVQHATHMTQGKMAAGR